jgi:hypothetical protein
MRGRRFSRDLGIGRSQYARIGVNRTIAGQDEGRFDLANAAPTKGLLGGHAGDNWRHLTAGHDGIESPPRYYDDVGALEADLKAGDDRAIFRPAGRLAPPAIHAMEVVSDGVAGRILSPA